MESGSLLLVVPFCGYTTPFVQVIEQMREISRTNAEKAAGFGQQLEEEKKVTSPSSDRP